MLPPISMRSAAEHATDGEIAAAADYFSKLRLSRRVEVIETDRVPATIATGWLYVLSEGAATEPLGQNSSKSPSIIAGTNFATPPPHIAPTCRRAASRAARTSWSVAATR